MNTISNTSSFTMTRSAGATLRFGTAMILLAFLGLLSGCGSSSKSFVSIGSGTGPTATLTSIAVAPTASSLPRGLTQRFTATATYSDGTQLDVSSSVVWASSVVNTASINATGVATAANLGGTTVTATFGAISGSTTLTVTAPTLVSISVTPPSPTIAVGSTQPLAATGNYTDSSTQNLTALVTWTSSNLLVATVSSAGVATAVSGGTSTISATLGTGVGAATGSTLLTVSGPPLVSISVTPANRQLPLGRTQQYTATGTYADGTQQPLTTLVTWNSSATAVATISTAAGTQGLATAVAVGTTTITATANGISGTAKLTVVASAYAYATNFGSNDVSEYVIAADGSLTPLGKVTAGARPFSIAINPAGTFAYVGNSNTLNQPMSNTISVYSIGVDGTLTPLGAPVPAGLNPNSVTIDASGSYLYVSNFDLANPAQGNVSQFLIGADGTLTVPIGGGIFPAGSGPAAVAITPANTFAYVANYGDGTVSQYKIGPGGALLPIANAPAAVPSGGGSSYVIVDPTGHYVYVANQKAAVSTITEYSIGSTNGALTLIGTVPLSGTTLSPSFIAIDASGQHAYVADSGSADVSQYDIVNGLLTPMVPAPNVPTGAGSRPYGVTIDATGKYVYVADRNSNVIHQFVISATDGSLSPPVLPTQPFVAAGTNPTSVAATP